MSMSQKGLSKLVEECGELTQIAGKVLAYGVDQRHSDGKGDLKVRLEDEISDVLAAISFVVAKFDLDQVHIETRANDKLSLFQRWDNE